MTINEKSVDGMLGSQTWGSRMEGVDESTEIWRHPPPKKKLTLFTLKCIEKIKIKEKEVGNGPFLKNEIMLTLHFSSLRRNEKPIFQENYFVRPTGILNLDCSKSVCCSVNRFGKFSPTFAQIVKVSGYFL